MRIRWDAALVAATARALEARYRDARVRSVLLDPDARRFVVYLREATWVWELHPERIGFAVGDPVEPPPEARPLPAKVRAVRAPADDRVLIVELLRRRGRPARVDLVLELMTNQENVLLLEGDDAVVRMLLRTREGERDLHRGKPYTLPPPNPRAGTEDDLDLARWRELTAGDDDRSRRSALMRGIAWMSRPLAEAILDEPDAEGELELWRRLRAAILAEESPGAALVQGRAGPEPFPIPLPGRTVREVDDLFEAFAAVADEAEVLAPLLPRAVLDRLERRVERLRGRVASLERELDEVEDPAAARAVGDLILARFGEIPAGASEVELVDFAGERRRVELDPALRPDENAERWYDRAGRMERAAERLPKLIESARGRWEEAEELLERARTGDADRSEIDAVLPEAPTGRAEDDGPTLPYRRYRTTSGREIRVGRGAARNDDLTFHHSAPNDVWLHARHTAGAHVILRWGRDENPDPRDLYEAGVLAALGSKARTSGSVPVDWTFRKYVRKPRKAPAGAVLPDRVKTVFVEPDEALEERLRDD